jgi:hypothetical protein
MKISYKVVEKESYDNVEKWQEDHDYGYYDRKDVEKVYELRVKMTVKYDGRKAEGKETFTLKKIYAVKYNGKWSLYTMDMRKV